MEYTKDWTLTRCSMGGATIEAGDMLIQVTFKRPLPLSVCEANAHLIATAPKLYEACKKVLPFIEAMFEEYPYVVPQMIQVLNQALAKAEGK